MDLERPDWFDRVTEWWCTTVGIDLARHAQPVGISPDGMLHVLCSDWAWSTQMGLLAHRVVERLNGARPEDLPTVAGITVLKPRQMPEELTQMWSDLVGADLADQVRPRSLSDWGQELVTEAESVQARDLLAQRAPFVLARLRATMPGNSIVRLRTNLRHVKVLIVSSPEFLDQRALEDALMGAWHDASQVYGPEHPLWIMHTGETAADRMAVEWVNAIQRTSPLPRPRVDALAYKVKADGGGPDAVRRRNERLVTGQCDLCLVFAVRAEEDLPLAELARERGVPVWQHVQQAEE